MTDAEAEEIYSRLHMAIEVAERCRKLELGMEEHERIGARIDEMIEHRIGARRLQLLTAAQREAKALVKKKGGCDSEAARDLLSLYDSELAPALKESP